MNQVVLQHAWQDAGVDPILETRYVLRVLVKNPGFTLTAIVFDFLAHPKDPFCRVGSIPRQFARPEHMRVSAFASPPRRKRDFVARILSQFVSRHPGRRPENSSD